MKFEHFEPIRQPSQPIFGVDRRRTISRFLRAILIGGMVVALAMILLRVLGGLTLSSSLTLRLLITLFVLQVILLFGVSRGYVDQVALILVVTVWLGVTYQAWVADGIRDVVIYFYFVIVFAAALLTSWKISVPMAVLSILVIWILAITEVEGLRAPHVDTPLNIARDLTGIFIILFLLIYLVINTFSHSLKAREASEQKYRNFVEQSMEGIWFLAFDHPIPTSLPAEEQVELIYKYGYVAESNDVLAQMYGYPSSREIRDVRLLDLQTGGEPGENNFQATLKLVKDGYRSGNRETREQTRDGRTVYFLNNAVGVIEDHCLVGLWGTQLDITALKNAEDALRLSEARTRALLDAIPDMIFEFNRDGTILQFIPSTTSRPLLPPEQFLGRNIREILPASVADQTTFAIERVLDSGHVHAFEYQLLQDDENRTFEARITPLSAATVLAMVRDVSLQKWILNEREKLITELELKNAELERFTYTASHDLKSPLITIKGFLGFLRQDAARGNLARLETDIQRISDAADKMQRLLNDLLELSRIGRSLNQAEWIDLNKMIAEVLELLHGRIAGGAVPIKVSVEENLPQVHGDAARLLEVWQNLIDNAAKFMGDQPNPHIEIGRAEDSKDGLPIFFVRDNGIGIDPKFNDRIFGLFDKLDPRTEGTGIGLALVKRIIEFHGARIWVESELGKGATFYFSLPVGETSVQS